MVDQKIPEFVLKYFWGDSLSELNLDKNKKYIIETLLEKGDKDALHWLLSHVDKQTILEFLPSLKLSKRSSNFWNIYLQNV